MQLCNGLYFEEGIDTKDLGFQRAFNSFGSGGTQKQETQLNTMDEEIDHLDTLGVSEFPVDIGLEELFSEMEKIDNQTNLAECNSSNRDYVNLNQNSEDFLPTFDNVHKIEHQKYGGEESLDNCTIGKNAQKFCPDEKNSEGGPYGRSEYNASEATIAELEHVQCKMVTDFPITSDISDEFVSRLNQVELNDEQASTNQGNTYTVANAKLVERKLDLFKSSTKVSVLHDQDLLGADHNLSDIPEVDEYLGEDKVNVDLVNQAVASIMNVRALSENLVSEDIGVSSILTDQPSYTLFPETEGQGISFGNCSGKIQTKQTKAFQKQFKRQHQNVLKAISEKHDHCEVDQNGSPKVDPDERYDKPMKILTNRKFDPDYDISLTYITSSHSAIKEDGPDCSFPKGIVPLGGRYFNLSYGYLVDGSPFTICVDGGATINIISKAFYDRNEFFQEYPILKSKVIDVKMANGTIEKEVLKTVGFMFWMGGHLFEGIAYVVGEMDDCDMLLGVGAQQDTEMNFMNTHRQCEFKCRSLPIVATKPYKIRPGKEDQIIGEIQNLPKDFNLYGEDIIVKMNLCDDKMQLKTLKVPCVHGRVSMTMGCLPGFKMIDIKKGQVIGYADMRSCGYMFVPREVLKRGLQRSFDFLTQVDLQATVNKVHQMVNNIHHRAPLQTDIKEVNKPTVDDPTPWLEPDDPRRNMSDEEILRTYVDLSKADLKEKEKEEVYKILLEYREAFSLRDEIGVCPDMEIELEVNDKTPFFVRPYPCKEEEKELIDKQMRKGCMLGIMKKGMSSYSSPIMLIPRKLGGIPRIVTDFRLLNTRLVRLNPSIPLVRDAVQILGASKAQTISVIDLRDAYHTLRLSENSQKYCGITPYYGSPTYLYCRMAMGLSPSPAIWQEFITKVLDTLPDRKHHLAIMDDCLIHSDKASHLEHLINLFKGLIQHGLKISPKKCQLFRKELVYMGHTITIEEHGPCIQALKTHLESVQKWESLKSKDDCRAFSGLVTFLSMYVPELQKLLIPIHRLGRQKVPFVWDEECEQNFQKIKQLLVSPPILSMPDRTGRLTLVSDTSKTACGATLYQKQAGKQRIIGYFSKTLPEPASRYSISELELFGLAVNIVAMKHLLHNVEFDVWVDHSALVHILRGIKEPPTLRIKKLMEILRAYKFVIHYMKGKHMYITDFLSRHPVDQGKDTDKIIPIDFGGYYAKVLKKAKLLLAKEDPEQTHLCTKCVAEVRSTQQAAPVTTRHRAKQEGIEVPSIYPLKGDHKLPEKLPEPEIIPPLIHLPEVEPQVIEQNMEQPNMVSNEVEQIPMPQLPPQVNNIPPTRNLPMPQMLQPPRMMPMQQIPIQPIQNQQMKLPQLLPPMIDLSDKEHELADILLRPPEESMFRPAESIIPKIDDRNIFRRHIPKQMELDKHLKAVKGKLLNNYELPLTIQEMIAEYKHSPYYKDIYKYIQSGECPFRGTAAIRFKNLCTDYILIEDMLFLIKYNKNPNKSTVVLCIPERYVPTILYLYHDIEIAGHQGVIKMYNTIRQKYHFPNMFECIRKYILCCHDCQSRRPKFEELDVTQVRIPMNFKPFQRFSMDVKHMPPSVAGYKFILCCTCEYSNYLEAIPLKNTTTKTIIQAVYHHIICRYGVVKDIIVDEASYFTSDMMNQFLELYNIKMTRISPGNHGSNKTERYIKTINDMICKYLSQFGQHWHDYVRSCNFAMNTYVNAFTQYSPHEILFLQQPPDIFHLDAEGGMKDIQVTMPEYINAQQGKRQTIQQMIKHRALLDKQYLKIRDEREHLNIESLRIGDLV